LTCVTEMPYFEGDFWPNILEESIKEVEQEELEKRRREEEEAAADTDDGEPSVHGGSVEVGDVYGFGTYILKLYNIYYCKINVPNYKLHLRAITLPVHHQLQVAFVLQIRAVMTMAMIVNSDQTREHKHVSDMKLCMSPVFIMVFGKIYL